MDKIIVAPDSFKGSIDTETASRIISEAVRSVLPDARTVLLPMGDGGEGTMRVLAENFIGEIIRLKASDPLRRPVETEVLVFNNGKSAFLETASICGLPLLKPEERHPYLLSTFGVGEVIKQLLKRGITEIYVGLGGSATIDGGIGMLSALGWRFLDKDGNQLQGIGKDLSLIKEIRPPHEDLIREVSFVAVCDVRNPLLGEEGAINVFGLQKGLKKEDLKSADSAMKNYAEVTIGHLGLDKTKEIGAGAAGGLGFALLSYLNARYISGTDFILDQWRFDDVAKKADLVITGEGSIDRQSLMGKVAGGLLSRCLNLEVPIIAFAGRVKDIELLKQAGFNGIYPICGPEVCDSEAMRPEIASANLYDTVVEVLRQNKK